MCVHRVLSAPHSHSPSHFTCNKHSHPSKAGAHRLRVYCKYCSSLSRERGNVPCWLSVDHTAHCLYPELSRESRCISSYSRFNSPSCKGVALMEANKPKTFAGQQSLCPHKSCPVAVSPGVLQRTEMCSQKKNLPFQQLSSVPSQLPTNENFQESFQCFVSKLLFSCLDRKEIILKFQSQTSFKDSIQHTQKCRNRINFILVDFFLFSPS